MEYIMSTILKLSNGNVIALADVKTLQPINEEEQTKLGERLEIDGSQFNTRITLANKSTQLARETVDQLKAQGVGLVDLGDDRFVPAANIMVAKPFSKEQADALSKKGYKLGQTFQATVETTAGIVLATGKPQQVMDRKVRAMGLTNG